jgi:hypothetical protein
MSYDPFHISVDYTLFPFLMVLGFAWWAATTVLKHSDKRADELSARIDELEGKSEGEED